MAADDRAEDDDAAVDGNGEETKDVDDPKSAADTGRASVGLYACSPDAVLPDMSLSNRAQ